MKKCHFRMAKLLEPNIKRNRTVIDFDVKRLVQLELEQL